MIIKFSTKLQIESCDGKLNWVGFQIKYKIEQKYANATIKKK